ncbi:MULTISPECIES: 3,4-dihydroxy-2-butanone-4-phosphate synthase [unclassified Rhodococcus (in: high G+C Gram-positive bacteria)]|uniref:3,4-dihydroxy-2-butanone-4-phosphate synthase n=1 Tax=unclassified Rhodococcus (in: high G+C Gram-positive bacteria) TaxID=192944 RepID=UPI0011EF2FED|nr:MULTISPECIES: 3,4-dihydroxy-2-butanone-4-phosphate synthase [unclassified Rhodococcus (in: high G+C Gram-positive bacteria)]KAA0924626.1 3,4-dihydroxy-2-butanone 4-phosphate synthase [Rhodococcus sp. ANT_H53B]MDI9926179.1 3,4-dihydroxy-2-butanone-4-phosphate synthase [Rhodococcus sp. IEGM 1341]
MATPSTTGRTTPTVRNRFEAGLPVVLATTGGEGLVVASAHNITTATMAFLVEHTSGFVRVALPQSRCTELLLPPMDPYERGSTRMCVGVDAADETGTGISAADRAVTARRLVDPSALPAMFTRPGHLVPVSVDDHERHSPTGSAEAALALTRAAGLPLGAVFAELVSVADPRRMMDDVESLAFARRHDLLALTH